MMSGCCKRGVRRLDGRYTSFKNLTGRDVCMDPFGPPMAPLPSGNTFGFFPLLDMGSEATKQFKCLVMQHVILPIINEQYDCLIENIHNIYLLKNRIRELEEFYKDRENTKFTLTEEQVNEELESICYYKNIINIASVAIEKYEYIDKINKKLGFQGGSAMFNVQIKRAILKPEYEIYKIIYSVKKGYNLKILEAIRSIIYNKSNELCTVEVIKRKLIAILDPKHCDHDDEHVIKFTCKICDTEHSHHEICPICVANIEGFNINCIICVHSLHPYIVDDCVLCIHDEKHSHNCDENCVACNHEHEHKYFSEGSCFQCYHDNHHPFTCITSSGEILMCTPSGELYNCITASNELLVCSLSGEFMTCTTISGETVTYTLSGEFIYNWCTSCGCYSNTCSVKNICNTCTINKIDN